MNDLHGALVALADRGTPTGSQLLRERVAVDLAGDRRRQWPAPPPRGLRLAVGAAIAVIVILGGALLLSQLTSNDTVTEPTVVTTAPSPDTTQPTPDAGPLPGFTPGAWGRVGADIMQPVAGLFDMTIVGSRMIAVGFDPDDNFRQDGVIFVSDDGETWTRLAEDDPALTLGFVLMYGVTEGGPGIVAVGMGCENEEEDCSPNATIWTSVDGTSWTRSPSDPEVFGDPAIQSSAAFAATTTTDGLIVAVGSMEDWVLTDEGEVESISGRPVVWTSTDGLAWERSWEGNRIEITLDQFNESSVGMTAVTAGADGLLVGVGESVDGSSLGIAAVWTSPDGVSWERIAHDPAVFAGPDGTPAQMFDIAAGDSGFVAVGNADGHPAAWTSPNGRSWQRSTGVDDEFNGSMSSVAALESGFVATGPQPFHDMSEAPVTLWTSPDGTTWDRVQILDYGYADAMIATPRGIAIAGGLHEDNDVHASVWTGTAFDPTAPPPVPALPEAPTEPAVDDSAALPDLDGLEVGLTCNDLSTLGYSYAQAASYWERHDRPAAMDDDGNGAPCEAVYDPSVVATVFGSAEALDVVLISDLNVNRFEATGPAVDAGLVCPAGTQEFAGSSAPRSAGAFWRWEDRYTCDDGSGSFVVGADVFIGAATHEYGVWDLGSGTGAYELLGGGGSVDTLLDESDVLTGRAEMVVLGPEPLYADGDVGCSGATDLTTPVGTVDLQPTADGVTFEVVLEGAAADWDYYVELAQPAVGDDCIGNIQVFPGFATDGAGNGVFTGTYLATPGTYLLLVDVVSDGGVPPDPRHREIGTAGFIEVTVPG